MTHKIKMHYFTVLLFTPKKDLEHSEVKYDSSQHLNYYLQPQTLGVNSSIHNKSKDHKHIYTQVINKLYK